MAEIPVERKSGGGLPWWLIPLLLLLLLIPLLFFLARGCNSTPVATNTNTNGNANRAAAANTMTNANAGAMTTNANAGAMAGNANAGATATNANTTTGAAANTGAEITDVSYFAGVNPKSSLVGRRANFANARVEKVVSDHIFTVKSGGSEMYVYLDESQDSAAGKEKAVRVKPGQVLNLSGDFRAVPNGELNAETAPKKDGMLSAKEFADMKGQQVYLHARVNNEGAAK